MLALKPSEYISLYNHSRVIYALSAVLFFMLLNNISLISVVATEQIESETKFAPEHIEKSCVKKCPDQVSERYFELDS